MLNFYNKGDKQLQKIKQEGQNNLNVGRDNYGNLTQIIQSPSTKNAIENKKAIQNLLTVFRPGSAELLIESHTLSLDKDRLDLRKCIDFHFTNINETNDLADLHEKAIGAIDALVAGEKPKFISEWNNVREELKKRIS